MNDNHKTKTKNKNNNKKIKIKINKLTKIGPHEPCKHSSHISHAKKKEVLIDPVYLYGLKVRLSGSRVVLNGPSVSKSYPKKKNKKSLSLS